MASNTEPTKITKEGLRKLEESLQNFQDRLAEVRRGKTDAAESGNMWHDNPAFEEAELNERMLMRQIADVQDRIRSAIVVELSPDADGSIQLGSTVVVRFPDGKVRTVTLLGSGEGDPANGKIAYDSPIGKALLGAKEGDDRSYQVGDRTLVVSVIKLEV